MSDDESDELPEISVVIRTSSQIQFKMPSADVIASERAKEEEFERELRLLRENDVRDVSALARSDSSGSESEASLAAAVSAMQVLSPPAAPSPAPHAAALVAALVHALPYPPQHTAFLTQYLVALHAAPADVAECLTDELLRSIESALCEANSWREEDVVCCGAWLCAALAWGAPRVRMPRVRTPCVRTLRAAQRLIDTLASDSQVSTIASCVSNAVREDTLRLYVSDALRGGGAASARLARALRRRALHDLVSPGQQYHDDDQWSLVHDVCARWRQLDAYAQYVVVSAAGRELAGGGDAARLLAALAQSAHRAHQHHPEHLIVHVGVSLLQLLFRDNK